MEVEGLSLTQDLLLKCQIITWWNTDLIEIQTENSEFHFNPSWKVLRLKSYIELRRLEILKDGL